MTDVNEVTQAPEHPIPAAVAPLARRVASWVGDELVAFGIRASDFCDVLWPAATLSITTLLDDGEGPSLERMTGDRVNPDLYDIDLDERPEASRLVRELIDGSHGRPLLLYRPSWRIEAEAASAGVSLLALPVARQRTLEDKRSVETRLEAEGVPTLEWFDLPGPGSDAPGPGPYVVRTAGQGGGAGMSLVGSLAEARAVPGSVRASRYVDGAASLNLSGCCFGDGTVSIHLPTVQVIGAAACTSLPFGYCGNDAPAIERIGPSAVQSAERLAAEVGRWLHRVHDWIGVFGIDVLIVDGEARFCELNPRFQGSSRMTAHHAIAQGRPGLFVEHLAAVAGIDPGPDDELGTSGIGTSSQLVVHNLDGRPARWVGPVPEIPGWRVELVPDPASWIASGGPIARLVTNGAVIDDTGLLPEASDAVAAVQRAVAP